MASRPRLNPKNVYIQMDSGSWIIYWRKWIYKKVVRLQLQTIRPMDRCQAQGPMCARRYHKDLCSLSTAYKTLLTTINRSFPKHFPSGPTNTLMNSGSCSGPGFGFSPQGVWRGWWFLQLGAPVGNLQQATYAWTGRSSINVGEFWCFPWSPHCPAGAESTQDLTPVLALLWSAPCAPEDCFPVVQEDHQ